MEIFLRFRAQTVGNYDLKARFLLGKYQLREILFSLHVPKPFSVDLILVGVFAVLLVIGVLIGFWIRKTRYKLLPSREAPNHVLSLLRPRDSQPFPFAELLLFR